MVRFDDLLNGGASAPAYTEASATALPTRPADGATDSATGGSRSTSKAVLMAWIGLFALLVFAHVITLDVQA